MTDPTQPDHADRELARHAAAALRSGPPGPCPGSLELAAYADGRCDTAGCEQLEAHLAACPLCLDAVLDARLGAAPPAEAVTSRVVTRAQALVATDGRLRGRASAWRAVAGWAAVAAAAVAVGVAGLHAGAAVNEARRQADERLVAEVTFDLAGDAPRGDLLEGFLAAARRAGRD